MFSANENIALRQQKRKVVQFVEECIPTNALDAGTSVMVMQVSCKAPGCVPLETAIVICFPRRYASVPFIHINSSTATASQTSPSPTTTSTIEMEELIPGLEESKNGGNFKTKILLPLNEVTKEDILDALPPCFLGGRRTMEKICLRVRDITFGQIMQAMGEDDKEGRKLMAEYLMAALKEYINEECIAPPMNEGYPSRPKDEAENETSRLETDISNKVGNIKPDTRRSHPKDSGIDNGSESGSGSGSVAEWKQRQKFEIMFGSISSGASSSAMRKISQREHDPALRFPGCQCCESNDLDNFMSII